LAATIQARLAKHNQRVFIVSPFNTYLVIVASVTVVSTRNTAGSSEHLDSRLATIKKLRITTKTVIDHSAEKLVNNL
jgi:hypothetical protein